jgi:hypothetical protein
VFSNVYEEIGTTKTGIGEGKANTKAIIAQAGHKESAAKLCDDLKVPYNGKSFNDYFLPSLDELNLMYKSLYLDGNKGNFSNNVYWSSSEHDYNGNACFQGFYSYSGSLVVAYHGSVDKLSYSAVRCARAF